MYFYYFSFALHDLCVCESPVFEPKRFSLFFSNSSNAVFAVFGFPVNYSFIKNISTFKLAVTMSSQHASGVLLKPYDVSNKWLKIK